MSCLRPPFKTRFARQRRRILPWVGAFVLTCSGFSDARNILAPRPGSAASQSSALPSQTATEATAATAQAAQAAVTAQHAQMSLGKALAAFQAAVTAQIAAHQAALANGPDLTPASTPDPTTGNTVNGLGVGLLEPTGGVPAATSSPAIQVVKLGTGNKSQLALGGSGSLTLPTGTSGSDQVTISGTGSVTTTGGTITTQAGIVTTTTGGTLAATNGGTVSVTAGTDTLTVPSTATAATITSTLAGTITLPAGGGTQALTANQATSIPAGSSISFSGSTAGTVSVAGAGTLTLNGAGTLALTNPASGKTGGTITTNTGTTSFTNGAVSSLSAGSTINLTGSGTIGFSSSTSTDSLPVILQSGQSQPFTTTGTLLSTTGYNVPNSWYGVGALSESKDGQATTDTITQSQSEAILNWNNFNVGRNTTLDFDQSGGGADVGTWVAYNLINNATSPSQILGHIEASGQVYVVNQNGIIFGASSQVDTHALVASSLPINYNLIGSYNPSQTDPTQYQFVAGSGILNNTDSQFLFSQDTVPTVQGGSVAPFVPPAVPTSGTIADVTAPSQTSDASVNSRDGDIIVNQGALITSPTNSEHVGGKIALIGTNVLNQGDLSSQDGQVILAAGQQVGFTAHPTNDPSLRGLDIAVGAGGGTVTNGAQGYIDGARADVTMAGATLNQLGDIYSTTSVALNGRIDLLAVTNSSAISINGGSSYFFGNDTSDPEIGGAVYLGPNSLTDVLPEYSSTDTAVGTSLGLPSQIYIEGLTFQMANDPVSQASAQILAPNATLTLSLGFANTQIAETSGEAALAADGTTVPPEPENNSAVLVPFASPGQVELDAGTSIDVSGSSDVAASVAENIISVQLRGAQLENSPLQKNGGLRGQTVQVDITQTGTYDGTSWVGSPIGDLSGYADLVERNVGELTTAGGTVTINTNGAVVMQPTSSINVSGGSIDYQGAVVQTSEVLTASGNVINISQATPNQVYQGVYTGFNSSSAKWGLSETFLNSLQSGSYYDPGYVQGGGGGTLNIVSSSATLNGSLYGNTTTGVRQQSSPPTPSSLNLTVQSANTAISSSAPAVDVVFQNATDPQQAGSTIYLSPDLITVDGFGNTSVESDNGNISVASDALIVAPAGGSLSLTAANIDVSGKIYLPAGKLTLAPLEEDPALLSNQSTQSYDPTRGNFTLESGAVLSTAGLSFDEVSGQVVSGLLPLMTSGGTSTVNGGTISIGVPANAGDGGAVVNLNQGSTVDASGGISRTLLGSIATGSGGSITLDGIYKDDNELLQGSVNLAGTLTAYGAGKGGTLTIKAPALQIGGVAPSATVAGDPTPLFLQPSFFSQGGFSNFSLSGAGSVTIESNLNPILTEAVESFQGNQIGLVLESSSSLPSYPAAPVNLSFSTSTSPFSETSDSSFHFGTLILEPGVEISTAPTSSVTLNGLLVDVEGEVVAPGGSISISGGSTGSVGNVLPGANYSPDVTVILGSQAVLNTNGEVITTTSFANNIAYTTGEVLPGGAISISGNIVGQPGAVLSADGASGVLYVPISSTADGLQNFFFVNGSPYVRQTVGSNGGQITLSGTEELFYDGSISARPGNDTALSGSLSVASGLAAIYTQPLDGSGNPDNAGFQELFVQQSGSYLDSFLDPGQTVTLGAPLPINPLITTFQGGLTLFPGGGYISADQVLNNQGYSFSSLTLNGNIEFQGNVSIHANQMLTITPDSQNGTIFGDNSVNQQINLTAPSVSIGDSVLAYNTTFTNSNFAPSYVANGTTVLTTQPPPSLAVPTYGSATLNVTATDLIDVGFLSLQNIGLTNFTATQGDIRGGGLLYGAGTVRLDAGQVYTTTGATFTIAAFDSTPGAQDGLVDLEWNGVARDLPLSAGGTINIYGSNINQNGVLVAPFGTINLGVVSSGSSSTPFLPITQLVLQDQTSEAGFDTYVASPEYNVLSAPVTQSLTLGPKSVTSVSGVGSNGQVLDIPYGTNSDGTIWYDPSGTDITQGGIPGKSLHLSGVSINDAAGSLIDLNGGGDLFAYNFNSGLGGTNDVLSSSYSANSFAILPGYQADYAPIDLTIDNSGNLPYANSSVTNQIGNQVYLAGGNGLAAGYYTILPARYALLTGAYLVTPISGTAQPQTTTNPDGSVIMSGYRYNNLDPSQSIVPTVTSFQIDSTAVVNAQAEYDLYSANTFLKNGATSNNKPVPRLPIDAGQLVFNATQNLQILGGLTAPINTGGLGSTVDIGGSGDIYIVPTAASTPDLTSADQTSGNYLTLAADNLNGFGADSLLIGGTRSLSTDGTVIDPSTNAIYVQNDADSALTGNEIILVSNQVLDLASGAAIRQSGVVSSGSENLIIGNANTNGSGDGTFVLVNGNPNTQVTRNGVNLTDTTPSLTVNSGASVSGVSVILDSTSSAVIDPNAQLDQVAGGQALVLQSGEIALQIDPQVSIASAPGLGITNATLQSLESSVQQLTLLSFSSIDLYGAGTLGGLDAQGQPVVKNLALEGAGIVGYQSDGGTVTFNAQNVLINNSVNEPLAPATNPTLPTLANSLVINADTVQLGANTFTVDGFTHVNLTASNGIQASGTGGFTSQGGLNLTAPLVTGATGANYAFVASGGPISVASSSGASQVTGGLGATLSLKGTTVNIASEILAPSGTISVEATTGNVTVATGGSLNVSGESIAFGSVTKDTSGGQVNLTSDQGSVVLSDGDTANGIYPVNVSAPAGGGNAGSVVISAEGTSGAFTVGANSLLGTAGANGTGGNFTLDIASISTLSDITNPLNVGGFQSLTFDVLTGSVTVDGAIGPAIASNQSGLTSVSLTAEQGGITIDNSINASGVYGGTIDLYADQGVTLTGNAKLSVAGTQLDSAGNGGTIDIETRGVGATGNNAINIEANATLDLSIAGGAGGVLHLRAPTMSNGTDLQINPFAASSIVNASSVILEGYNVYDTSLTTTAGQNTSAGGGQVNAALEGSSTVNAAGTIYGDAQAFTNNTDNILTRLLGLTAPPTADQMALYQVTPGAEITNSNTSVNGGNLTLASNWNLSSFRFGPNNVAGDLTLRAAGNLVFTASLTDGFAYNSSDTENVAASPYTWDVLAGPSWSYRLVAGAAFDSSNNSTANYGEVQSLAALGLNNSSPTNAQLVAGSLLLGTPFILKNNSSNILTSGYANQYAQLIRTGTGDITIDTGGSVDLMNQLATIYTAGTLAPALASGENFDSPTGKSQALSEATYEKQAYGQLINPADQNTSKTKTPKLTEIQYSAQYTQGGGNITINAQQDIAHLTVDTSGNYTTDTSWQFPTNWLYHRGASSAGVYDLTIPAGAQVGLNTQELATTTWWIDFANFFEGIGALGGGNVTLNAGGNITNVDAVVPTDAYTPYTGPVGTPSQDVAGSLVELGGGNLSVVAGGTIAGGTYYVEKGAGLIQADTIFTDNSTDSVRVPASNQTSDGVTLPLTLFLGDGSFNVEATNNLTIGSTVNPFWLPQSLGNGFNDQSIFSTYAANSSVSLSSLLGTITIQDDSTGSTLGGSLYEAYLANTPSPIPGSLTYSQVNSFSQTPWTLLLDSNPYGASNSAFDQFSDYQTFFQLNPPVYNAAAFSGSVQYQGNQVLVPSSQGTLQLVAAKTVEGAYADSSGNGQTASIILLDDNPALLPTAASPFGFGSLTGLNSVAGSSIITSINQVVADTGESLGYTDQSLPTLQSFHTPGLLHTGDTTVQIDTISGDISDFTLLSPEKVAISSGLDLQDVSFYIQNNSATDISTVTANRDITLFDLNSAGLSGLQNPSFTQGDIQLGGQGTLEVLAGRNLDLGTPPSNYTAPGDGTGLGIVSIGNSRDPYLPFAGANIVLGAGLGSSSSLDSATNLNFPTFINTYLNPSAILSSRYLPDLGQLMGLSSDTNQEIWNAFEQESPEQQDTQALTVFYDVLANAALDHNDPTSPDVGTYKQAFAAIADLFPNSGSYQGDISMTARDLKTTNGGDISLIIPGGQLTVGLNTSRPSQDQGILTVSGGSINIFANGNVNVGTSRIFTLHGGDETIYSQVGNIDAGNGSKTVQSAPPTRVLVDAQSADVKLDLAGLSTGSGIGVLATVVGAAPGNVDLIAPNGTVDAGDAGIRASGNILIAAAHVVNASNIQSGGSSSGVPTSSAPNVSATVAASSAGGASQNAANEAARQQQNQAPPPEDLPSIISVEVIGYGGSDDDSASTAPSSPDKTVATTGAG